MPLPKSNKSGPRAILANVASNARPDDPTECYRCGRTNPYRQVELGNNLYPMCRPCCAPMDRLNAEFAQRCFKRLTTSLTRPGDAATCVHCGEKRSELAGTGPYLICRACRATLDTYRKDAVYGERFDKNRRRTRTPGSA